MHPAKVEYRLIYPSLKKLFENCDKKDGYWTYMSEMFTNQSTPPKEKPLQELHLVVHLVVAPLNKAETGRRQVVLRIRHHDYWNGLTVIDNEFYEINISLD